jgi:putative hydrolases of HD superfamily
MTDAELAGTLAFLRRAEALKSTLRSGFTATGRPESTAEHTWRLCLFAMLLARHLPGIDHARLVEMLIVHDLGEAISGDIPATMQAGVDKAARERADFIDLVSDLPEPDRTRLLDLHAEYEAAATPEAILAKGLDKLETILQHQQGMNPADFDHAFNLGYGRSATDRHPLLARVHAVLDERTRALAG